MLVSELTGRRLDFWVHRALGDDVPAGSVAPAYSTDWAHGGPVIADYGLWLRYQRDYDAATGGVRGYWRSAQPSDEYPPPAQYVGHTPLVAAMRQFVATHFGESVPEQK